MHIFRTPLKAKLDKFKQSFHWQLKNLIKEQKSKIHTRVSHKSWAVFLQISTLEFNDSDTSWFLQIPLSVTFSWFLWLLTEEWHWVMATYWGHLQSPWTGTLAGRWWWGQALCYRWWCYTGSVSWRRSGSGPGIAPRESDESVKDIQVISLCSI